MALAKSIIVYAFIFVVAKPVKAISNKSKGTVLKTIYSEDGDIFDCVDIYEQPSFENPLLKNEKYKIPELLERFNYEHNNSLSENETEDCPHGTVPIIRFDRPDENEIFMMRNMKKRHSRKSINTSTTHDNSNNGDHEYAVMTPPPRSYYGVKALLNVWKPFVANSYEFSLAQIWVTSGERDEPTFGSIEAGWMVSSFRHQKDLNPRLFVFWTSDDYKNTGCYDLDCKGFTLIGRKPKYAPGSLLRPWSTYNSAQYNIGIAIQKDQHTGDWFLYINDYSVGYWPQALFKDLAEFADEVELGGEIINARVDGHHTTTQMGSGHPAREGYKKAAYVRDIKVMQKPHGNWEDPPAYLFPGVTHPTCYSLNDKNFPFPGVGFFYGGSGYSNSCP